MLPIYEILIDDEVEGMYTVSLVANPATERSWMAFSEDKKVKLNFNIVDNEQHKVMCVICRCDFPIYRIDPQTLEEFYVIYHSDTIEKMTQKFLKCGFQSAINIEHNPNNYVDGVELQEIFIKNSEKGISPKGFEDVEEGSLFGVYKIENQEVWQAIKDGVFTSVSLEGMFKLKPEEKEEKTIENFKDLLEWLNKK